MKFHIKKLNKNLKILDCNVEVKNNDISKKENPVIITDENNFGFWKGKYGK